MATIKINLKTEIPKAYRVKTVRSFTEHVKEQQIAKELEKGVYRFTRDYCIVNQITEDFFLAIYDDKLRELLRYMKPDPETGKKTFLKKVIKKKLLLDGKPAEHNEMAYVAP